MIGPIASFWSNPEFPHLRHSYQPELLGLFEKQNAAAAPVAIVAPDSRNPSLVLAGYGRCVCRPNGVLSGVPWSGLAGSTPNRPYRPYAPRAGQSRAWEVRGTAAAAGQASRKQRAAWSQPKLAKGSDEIDSSNEQTG